MGLVLPSSLMFADYARSLRDIIRQNFLRSVLVKLNYQTFMSEGAEERAVVLLSDGFGSKTKSDWIEISAASEDDAVKKIQDAGAAFSISRPGRSRSLHYRTVFEDIASDLPTKTIGELAKIDIGVVTGDNKFFILTHDKAQHEGLQENLFTPIVSRATHVPGLVVGLDQLEILRDTQSPCLLLTPNNIDERHTVLRKYLATMPRQRRKTGVWLNKRDRWYCPDVGAFPDAVLTYMNHLGPRLVLLDGRTTCSNTLHRVWFPGADQTTRKLISLSLISTFSQLSAEIEGRSYGGGVLKIEPSDARRLRLILPEGISRSVVDKLFGEADLLSKTGRPDEARDIADRLVLQLYLGPRFAKTLSNLRKDLQLKRVERHTQRTARNGRDGAKSVKENAHAGA
jgi:hypothetical protein